MRYSGPMPDITSKQNDKLRLVEKLRDRRHRDREGLFVVEGPRAYGRANANGWKPVLTLIEDGYTQVGDTTGSTYSVEPSALDSVSYRSRSAGLIGVFETRHKTLAHLDLSPNPLILVLEGIEKPGNLGAILRTAVMTSVEAVVLVDCVVDIYNPNVIRASTGAIFEVAVIETNWDEFLAIAGKHDLAVRAATPEAGTSLWDIDWMGPAAVVIGSEAKGLTPQARTSSVDLFSIPGSENTIDSLNASVAAAVVLYEAVRQRRK